MKVVGSSVLDQITWSVEFGPAGVLPTNFLNAASWTTPAASGYNSPGPAVSNPPMRIVVNWQTTGLASPTLPQFVGFAHTFTAGVRYRITAQLEVVAGSTPPRLHVGPGTDRVTSTPAPVTGGITTLEVVYAPTTTGTRQVGLIAPVNARGSALIRSLQIATIAQDYGDRVADGVNIRYGRTAYLQDVSPASATFSVVADGLSIAQMPYPSGQVIISASSPDDTFLTGYGARRYSRRFTGKVIAVDYRRPVFAVTCTSALADLERTTFTASAPTETEINRVSRVLDAATADYVVEGSSRATFLPKLAEPVGSLTYLQDVCFESGALLAEQRGGTIRLLTGQYFDQVKAMTTIPDDWIDHNRVQATYDLSRCVNRATVEYGARSTTWDYPTIFSQATVTASNSPAITTWGLRARRYQTDLADAGSANALAAYVIDVLGVPRWELEAAAVRAEVADVPAAWWEIADLSIGEGVRIPAAALQWVDDYDAIIQGWAETISETSWTITYHLGRYQVGGLGTITWSAATGKTWTPSTTAWKLAVTAANLA